ncbi:hypothetical protein [Neolewinella sp.]|uniref:hypothetical protein n=1 Tax=Neolewinella sp. TaxID=2993543 RepID=UPI003B525C8E
MIQSHPDVVAPTHEVNQMTGGYGRLRFIDQAFRALADRPKLATVGEYYFESKFKWNVSKPGGVNNGIGKAPGRPYTRTELEAGVVCFKGVCSPKFWSLTDNDLIERISRETVFVSLIRDGFSVCEGWIRRGTPPRQAARLYNEFCRDILQLDWAGKKHKIVRFEDVLADPFGQAEQLHDFCELRPLPLDHVRLKVKKVMTKDGGHSVSYGRQNEHYWFDRDTITEIIQPNVNAAQRSALSEEVHRIIVEEAGEGLAQFGYLAQP